MKRIIGIGNALIDILSRIESDDLLRQMNLPKGSMQLLDDERYREISATLARMDTQRATGGSACNTMLALAQLGEKPAIIGKVGQDENARFFADNCKTVGIEPYLLTDGQHQTGVASTFISTDGQRTFGTYLGAAALLEADDINPEWLSQYEYLYIEGYLVQNHALLERLLELASQYGMKICLDLASYNIVEADRDFFAHLLEHTHIVFANEDEARAFTGQEPEEALAQLSAYCHVAVVKVGKHGVLAQCDNERVQAPAMEEAQVVDTNAAGDFFAAGFLYAWLQGATLQQCAEAGGITAGHVIQYVGTKMPEAAWQETRLQMQQLLQQ